MLAHILWRLIPTPPHSLTPPPRHTSHALGQRAPKPTIRSWLGGGGPPPHQNTPLDTGLDTGLDMGYSSSCRSKCATHRFGPTPNSLHSPPLTD